MKSKFILLLFCGAMIFGCSSDPQESIDSQPLVSTSQSMGPERPFMVSGLGTFEAGENTACPGYPLQFNLEGTGNATHIGLFTVELTWCFVPPEGPLYLFGTITAANGDTLDIQTTGQGEGPNGEVYETFEFTGGTGRFEEVSGEFDLYTTTVFDPICGLCGTYTNYGEGYISY